MYANNTKTKEQDLLEMSLSSCNTQGCEAVSISSVDLGFCIQQQSHTVYGFSIKSHLIFSFRVRRNQITCELEIGFIPKGPFPCAVHLTVPSWHMCDAMDYFTGNAASSLKDANNPDSLTETGFFSVLGE